MCPNFRFFIKYFLFNLYMCTNLGFSKKNIFCFFSACVQILDFFKNYFLFYLYMCPNFEFSKKIFYVLSRNVSKFGIFKKKICFISACVQILDFSKSIFFFISTCVQILDFQIKYFLFYPYMCPNLGFKKIFSFLCLHVSKAVI